MVKSLGRKPVVVLDPSCRWQHLTYLEVPVLCHCVVWRECPSARWVATDALVGYWVWADR